MLLPFIAVALVATSIADNSLKEALQAVQKRQRDLIPPVYYSRPYVYGDGQPEDIGYGYQKSGSPSFGIFDPAALPYSELGSRVEEDNNKVLEKLILDYMEEGVGRETKRRRRAKRIKVLRIPLGIKRSSVFRERDPESMSQQFDEDTPIMPSLFRERDKNRIQNAHALVRNYGGLNFDGKYSGDDEEDDYLSVLSQLWEKYKNEVDTEEMTEADVEEILEYLARKGEQKRQYGGPYDMGFDFFNQPSSWSKKNKHKRYQNSLFDERYPLKPQKRYPIAKRSPPLERHKKSGTRTDPKVAAELSNIFEEKPNATEITQVTITTPEVEQIEHVDQTNISSTEPIQVKKKSINWSDYFGLDRKKKSNWLVNQYEDTYAAQQDKKHHDEIDQKMKAMEDMIVDEAIKYTGSREGTKNIKEIQEVKDKVMSQLAAAYSLEKMRRALGEFKSSIAAQKVSAPASHSIPLPKSVAEHLTVAPNTKAEAKKEINNDIKPRIHPSISSITTKVVEETDTCPILLDIEMKCRRIGYLSGDKTDTFGQLCSIHQLCYLCGSELRASSPRECDGAFAAEAESLCNDDPSCLYISRRVLYMVRRLATGSSCNWKDNPCLAQVLAMASAQS